MDQDCIVVKDPKVFFQCLPIHYLLQSKYHLFFRSPQYCRRRDIVAVENVLLQNLYTPSDFNFIDSPPNIHLCQAQFVVTILYFLISRDYFQLLLLLFLMMKRSEQWSRTCSEKWSEEFSPHFVPIFLRELLNIFFIQFLWSFRVIFPPIVEDSLRHIIFIYHHNTSLPPSWIIS